MLPAAHRLRRPAEFTAVLRGPGCSRAGGRLVVVHAAAPLGREGLPSRVGFVVSKAVGGAVQRNLVKRRLREAVRARLDALPCGTDTVVRANPAAAGATFTDLCEAVDRQLPKALGQVRPAAALAPAAAR